MSDAPPIPANLALPPGEPEPMSEFEFEQLTREALGLADEAGIDPEAAVELLLEPKGDEFDNPHPFQRAAYIEDDEKAEWAVRKLAAIEAETVKVTDLAYGWMQNIEGWQSEQLRPLAARRAFLESALKDYMRRLRTAKKKSHPLPSGRLTSTASSAKLVVLDDRALLTWLWENAEPDAVEAVVKTEHSVRLTELREHFGHYVSEDAGTVINPETGEQVPGTSVEPAKVTYGVKVNR